LCPPVDPDAPGINARFTLIEALVTLAVIAISLAVIGSVVPANVRGTITVDQRIGITLAGGVLLDTRQFLGFRQTAHRRLPTSCASKTLGKRIELSTIDARICAVDAINAEPDPKRK
jgi:hypothetical protein